MGRLTEGDGLAVGGGAVACTAGVAVGVGCCDGVVLDVMDVVDVERLLQW